MNIDVEEALTEEYNSLSLGQRVQILWAKGHNPWFMPGTIVGKHIEKKDWDSKICIDVLLDTGEMVTHYNCYSGFYPRYDKI